MKTLVRGIFVCVFMLCSAQNALAARAHGSASIEIAPPTRVQEVSSFKSLHINDVNQDSGQYATSGEFSISDSSQDSIQVAVVSAKKNLIELGGFKAQYGNEDIALPANGLQNNENLKLALSANPSDMMQPGSYSSAVQIDIAYE